MNYLSVENLTKTFGDLRLFSDISFGINRGDKVALIAKNGTGKSTLLNIISGIDSADSGNISYRKDIKIEFLSQNPIFGEEETVFETLLDSDIEEIKALRFYEKCLSNPKYQSKLSEALEKMDRLKAWDIEARVKQILFKLNITNLERRVSTLSGGERKRVFLAKTLVTVPDFLILDEPTNHLDLDMIEWLEEFLSDSSITLFMVTHDRYFLERICNRIFELDNNTLYKYDGNYSDYLRDRELRYEIFEKSVSRAQTILKKELHWIMRQPRARGSRSKVRIEEFHKLKKHAETNFNERLLDLEIAGRRIGGKIVNINSVSKSFGDKIIIKDFSYKFKKGERVGIVGKNGSGKSTFLNLITSNITPDSGYVEKGKTIVFGYYTQEGIKFNEEKNIIDAVKDVAEIIDLKNGNFITASKMLERFLFPTSTHYVKISRLSGGEKRRLYLLTILMRNPNFLILDEPTNDFDILTLNILEEFLLEYKGCLLIVSHDRYFMDKLVDHLFIFEGGGVIKDYMGNYSLYHMEKKLLAKEEKKEEPVVNKKTVTSKNKKKFGFKEKKRFEELEVEIEKLETEKSHIINEINNCGSNYQRMDELNKTLEELTQKLDNFTEEWIELSELSEFQ